MKSSKVFIFIILLDLLQVKLLKAKAIRNPFSFINLNKNDNYKCKGIAKFDKGSKRFAMLSIDNNIYIIKPGSIVLDNKIVAVFDDFIIVEDENKYEYNFDLEQPKKNKKIPSTLKAEGLGG